MLRYRPWQYTKYSLRALPCLTQIRLGNLSQRLIGEEYETCFVPKGTKLAARFARCFFVKTNRFNEKQYQTLAAFMLFLHSYML